MNRKGANIAISLVPIVAIVLISLVVFYLVDFDSEVTVNSATNQELLSALSFKEIYIEKVLVSIINEAVWNLDQEIGFKERFDSEFRKVANSRDPKDGSFGNFFASVRNEEYTLNYFESKDEFELIMDIRVSVDKDFNEYSKNLHFEIVFDRDGFKR